MSTGLVEQVRANFYRFSEAADALEVNPVTLWRWVKEGKVEVHRLGREVLIEKRIVETLQKR